MNDVYVSGFITDTPILKMEREDTPHLIFSINVTHRGRNGKIHHEVYRVNTWHSIALRANELLKPGQYVIIHGYLTQRLSKGSGFEYIYTELTAKDFTASTRVNPYAKTKNARFDSGCSNIDASTQAEELVCSNELNGGEC